MLGALKYLGPALVVVLSSSGGSGALTVFDFGKVQVQALGQYAHVSRSFRVQQLLEFLYHNTEINKKRACVCVGARGGGKSEGTKNGYYNCVYNNSPPSFSSVAFFSSPPSVRPPPVWRKAAKTRRCSVWALLPNRSTRALN